MARKYSNILYLCLYIIMATFYGIKTFGNGILMLQFSNIYVQMAISFYYINKELCVYDVQLCVSRAYTHCFDIFVVF